MRLSLRFIIPLLLALGALAYAVQPLVNRLTVQWFTRDLDIRANLIAVSAEEPLQDLTRGANRGRMLQYFARLIQDERLYAVGYCSSPAAAPVATATMPAALACDSLDRYPGPDGHVLASPDGPLLVSVKPLATDSAPAGRLVLVHDMSFVVRRSRDTRRYLFYFFVGLAVTVSLITVVIAQLSWRGWEQGVRALLRGEGLLRPVAAPELPEFRPIADDLRALIRDLDAEHRERHHDYITWGPDTLRDLLHRELRGQEIIVLSNREPYIHVRRGTEIVIQRPASGLVTALEPIMRACSGTWIAHGSGSADREVVDANDRVGIPPEQPAYRIRRIWLTSEEESGYYFGFANEGLWPLCHIAHTRPVFRASDWEYYQRVNEKFAQAVLAEIEGADRPFVLIQDYHFALLPTLIKAKRPDAHVAIFWHIPWPNAEAFRICPWERELLDGLLGADLVSFHIQAHCNNFLETVDQSLQSRIAWDRFTVNRNDHLTLVRPHPISVALPEKGHDAADEIIPELNRSEILKQMGPATLFLGVGVDRIDYTKGIVERFGGIEYFLDKYPHFREQFTFVQFGAPSRTQIKRYLDFLAEVEGEAERINRRFQTETWKPIVLRSQHHSHQEILPYYKAADFCLITSLHDGMNLVAKEFVAARDDEDGVLILSQFTGASRELTDALPVNPYDITEMAEMIRRALEMPSEERQARMKRMRRVVREHNVYRWAAELILELSEIRIKSPEMAETR